MTPLLKDNQWHRLVADSMSVDRIAELLVEIYTDFQLDSKKLVATVTEKGSSFENAFDVFGVETTSLSEFESDHNHTLSSYESNDTTDNENEIELAPKIQSVNPDKQSRNVYQFTSDGARHSQYNR